MDCRPSGRTHQCTSDLVVTLSNRTPSNQRPQPCFSRGCLPTSHGSFSKEERGRLPGPFLLSRLVSVPLNLLLVDIATHHHARQATTQKTESGRYLATVCLQRNTCRNIIRPAWMHEISIIRRGPVRHGHLQVCPTTALKAAAKQRWPRQTLHATSSYGIRGLQLAFEAAQSGS